MPVKDNIGHYDVMNRILLENDRRRLLHSRSLFRFTYRSGFETLSPYHYSDDAGWGCMLRSAQMIMAQAFSRHILGTGCFRIS